MRNPFLDYPIQKRLMVVFLLTISFALLLMVVGLIIYELSTFRRSIAINTQVLGTIIGSNSTAAIVFENPKDADEVLSALEAEKSIEKAAIYTRDGQLFARYPSHLPLPSFPSGPHNDGHIFTSTHLEMFQPIREGGERVGTIFLLADLSPMYSRFIAYGGILISVGVCAALAALGLSTRMQQQITRPILKLTDVARSVSTHRDYSRRADKSTNDEIGELTESFNQMLNRIGESNAALAASEHRLRMALEGSRTGTWEWNPHTNRVTWDSYMYPLYGIDVQEGSQTFYSSLSRIHPDDRQYVEDAMRAAFEERRDLNISYRILLADGSIRYMATRGRAFGGDAPRMSGVSMDVTPAKQAEEELQSAKEVAETANRAKDDFLAILSHEMRTPLTPVLATVALLNEECDLPPSIRSHIETIRRNVEVEARLIDDLLDITRIARGKFDLHRKMVNIRDLLEHAYKNYCSLLASQKDLRVTFSLQATKTFANVDASRMTQVFWNLLQNACKFTPSGGRIGIRLFNEPARVPPGVQPDVILEVSDTGIGIDPEFLPRIFDAFEQGNRKQARQFGGLGLGLAISKAIVDLHGGKLTATSFGEGQGATFTLRLKTMAEPQVHPLDSEGDGSRKMQQDRRASILLVEDHMDSANQLSRLLRRAGHRVTHAASLAEAREILAGSMRCDGGQDIELLLSDLGLPDGSGHDLMREISNRNIPGIALSGYGMDADIRESKDAGFCCHITKPIDWSELKDAIQQCLADVERGALAGGGNAWGSSV